MQQAGEFLTWTAVVVTLLNVGPRFLEVIRRGKWSRSSGELARFEAIHQAHERQLAHCEQRCGRLEEDLAEERRQRIEERTAWVAEREHFHEQLTAANRRIWLLEEQRLRGWKNGPESQGKGA